MRPLRGYIPTLDGWRAIAVLGVILSHISRAFACSVERGETCVWAQAGAHGVGLFFAISGLLITARLLEEETTRGNLSLRDFYIRRACRILPPALTYLAVIGLLILIGMIPHQRWEILASATFWRNYLPGGGGAAGWYTGHFWSLAVEEHFYLLWPALLLITPRNMRLSMAIALAALVSVWRILDGHYRWVENATTLRSWQFYLRSDTRLDALLLGCIFALALSNERVRETVARFYKWPLVLLALVLYAMLVLPVAQTSRLLVLESLLAPALLLATIMRPTSIVGRVLESGPMRWVGRLSYSLYLWQQLFFPFDKARPLGFLQWWPIAIVATFACAALSYRLVERPMIRLGHRLARPVTPGRSDAESRSGSRVMPPAPHADSARNIA